MPRRRVPEARTKLESIVMFVGLLVLWCGGLTLFFSLVFDDFVWDLMHPMGGWGIKNAVGFLLLYAMLSIPVFPIYNRLDDWWEKQRREALRERQKEKSPSD